MSRPVVCTSRSPREFWPRWLDRRARVVLLGTTLCLVAGCQSSTTATAPQLAVTVRVPTGADNPLADADARFIAAIAEYPGAGTKLSTVQPYVPGLQLKVPAVPFGASRQIAVEVYSGSESPQSRIARGASVPIDVTGSTPAPALHPYVTRINSFAPVFGEPDTGGQAHKMVLAAPHVATSMVALPNGKVLMTGGAVPKPSAKDPYDPASYSTFQSTVALYDPDLRSLVVAKASSGQLTTPRAFHSVAVGNSVVAIVGGVELDEFGKPRSSNKIEFYNMETGKVTIPTQTEPTMHFGRVAPTVIQMFEEQDYFLILGGKGNEDCPVIPHDGLCGGNTWEIWHPSGGFKAMGQLGTARWHHAGVRVPGPDSGGFVMLIGGENTQGAVKTMEVVQFGSYSGSVLVSDSLTNCPADCPAKPAGFLWNPVFYTDLPVRIWPAALYVANVAMSYYHVYMIGGFGDLAHTIANKSVDVFDIMMTHVIANLQMTAGRAAPIVAAVTSGPSSGQVLIAGGSSTETTHWSSGEFLRVASDGSGGVTINIAPVANAMGDGERALGAAVGLSTGHVLLLGGTGGNATSLSPRTDASLWNPYY